MKIISKFKDYYDWVVFETDNRKVYVRNRLEVVLGKFKNFDPDKHIVWPIEPEKEPKSEYHPDHEIQAHIGFIFFCNKVYNYLKYEDKYYWKYDDIPKYVIKKITPKNKKYPNWDNRFLYFLKLLNHKMLGQVYENRSWSIKRKEPLKLLITDLNRKVKCPVIGTMNENGFGKVLFNPNLGEIGFNKMLTPEQAYQEIYNWIPYEEPAVPSSPDDMSRYEAKGFDEKTSFRPKMKLK